ncbi:tyrosine-type recombinase/integrase [Roseomonas xinghualingensis]|uniref:tyrosine-type recombinase/integrase n=1 Tax=Roseomonas xinghualingensis TaxID=2986475 RepID=UPI0021F1D5DE|nr:integrase family protein [Roseomonas sp. SXEYE001]MCV4206880.1 integrase family protein [Roseomonas sp. SXEYE001]
MRITKRACEELAKSQAFEKRTVHWDQELRGFGLRVNGPGRLSFVLKYRVRGDKQQRYFTLGDWPAVAPDSARREAATIKVAAARGQDLIAERRLEAETAAQARKEEKRRALPVSELLDAWRAATEAEIARKAAEDRSVLYERELLRLEEKILRPAIGKATVGSLDPLCFQALIEVQTSVSTARNLRNLLVRFIRFTRARLVLQGITVHWPASFEVAARPVSRSFRFSLEETARIWIAAGALGRRGALVRFMLLTGCRRIEAQKVQRAHLVLNDPTNGPYWAQPSHLVKNSLFHRVPLSGPAVALVSWLPDRGIDRHRDVSPLLFAGRGGKLVGDWTVIRRALLEGAGLTQGTLHDFRRTIVSTLGDNGFDPQVADSLLNHAAATTMSGVMSVYQVSEFWKKKRQAIDLWTRLLMKEVARLQGVKPRDVWRFSEPFEDARIRRPERAGTRAQKRAQRRRVTADEELPAPLLLASTLP